MTARTLRLSLACGDYDRHRALWDGSVRPEGIDLVVSRHSPEEIFWRQARHADFDVAEMSLAAYLIERSRGDDRFIALPVFPSRAFRHNSLFVNIEAGIEQPADLRGKRVGVPEYAMTAAVWVRAFLEHDYGVPPRDIAWVTGGLLRPGREERVALRLPPDVHVEPAPPGRTLDQMLESGELAALTAPRVPPSYQRGSPSVRRLFPDYAAVEAEYYHRTGLFPIMHTVVIRQEIFQQHPWVAPNLVQAFVEAKEAAQRALRETIVLHATLPTLMSAVEEAGRTFGADPWPYGVAPNRRPLEALLGYCWEQGLLDRPLAVDELFASNTYDLFGA